MNSFNESTFYSLLSTLINNRSNTSSEMVSSLKLLLKDRFIYENSKYFEILALIVKCSMFLTHESVKLLTINYS